MEDKIRKRPFNGHFIISYFERFALGCLRNDEGCKTTLDYKRFNVNYADYDDIFKDQIQK